MTQSHTPTPHYSIEHDKMRPRTFITAGQDSPRRVLEVLVIGHADRLIDRYNSHDALVAALRQYRQAWDNVQHMNGYREGQGDLWAGPEFSRADIAARAALAIHEGKHNG